MKIIKAAEAINYEGPQWLVVKLGSICEPEDVEVINDEGYEIIAPRIRGWRPYNCIIKDVQGNYYLARWGKSTVKRI